MRTSGGDGAPWPRCGSHGRLRSPAGFRRTCHDEPAGPAMHGERIRDRRPLVGVVMGSRSDWETMRHASEILAELGIPHEAQGRLGAPDARAALPLRPRGRGAGAGGPDRRGRGRGAPAGDARGDLRSCRCSASRSRARCSAGSIRSCRSSRCREGIPVGTLAIGACRRGQRGAAGRGDPGAERSRRSARRWPRSAQAQTDAVGESPI